MQEILKQFLFPFDFSGKEKIHVFWIEKRPSFKLLLKQAVWSPANVTRACSKVFVRSAGQLLGWGWHKFLMTFSSLTEDFLKLYTFLHKRYQAVPTTGCNNEQMSPFWADKTRSPSQFELVGGETLPAL